MGGETVAQAVASVLENLEVIENNAQSVLDQCAEEKAVLEGLLLLMGWSTYRQKNEEKGVENEKNGSEIGENGPICAGVAV